MAAESCGSFASSSSSSSSSSNPTVTVEPNTFDLIVYGTGLQESILVATAASAGKSVLHLSPFPFYASHFSTQNIPNFFRTFHPDNAPSPLPASELADYDVLPLHRRCLYSILGEHGSYPESTQQLELDLAGPRVVFSADSMADLLGRSGANKYAIFKSITSTMMYWNRELSPVPDSYAAIFRDLTNISLTEKARLINLVRIIQAGIGQ